MKNSSRTLTVLLQPRDPLIARDARPFDPTPGARATTLNWPWPQTIAGALRTHIGRAIGLDWGCHEDLIRIHRTAIQGPLLATRRRSDASTGGWQVYFPAPADAVVVLKSLPKVKEPTSHGQMTCKCSLYPAAQSRTTALPSGRLPTCSAGSWASNRLAPRTTGSGRCRKRAACTSR